MSPTASPAVSAPAAKAGVIGSPIGHSRSPALHRAAYRLLGFDCGYEAYNVTPGGLHSFIEGLRTDPTWCGLSVTMPHKAAMMELVDEVAGHAAALGVLNTVTMDGSGPTRRLTGHNTDVGGIVGALRHAGVTTPPGSAVVLGGGGTAAAAVAALRLLGAATVTVVVRSPERAESLAGLGGRLDIPVDLQPFSGAVGNLRSADVVISTLPPGGADTLAQQLGGAGAAPAGAGAAPVLLDVAYDPWPSPLAAAWEAAGGTIVPGLEMLIYQAVEQVRLFSGATFTDDAAVLKVMCDAVGAPPR